jgi:hypothetical protein
MPQMRLSFVPRAGMHWMERPCGLVRWMDCGMEKPRSQKRELGHPGFWEVEKFRHSTRELGHPGWFGIGLVRWGMRRRRIRALKGKIRGEERVSSWDSFSVRTISNAKRQWASVSLDATIQIGRGYLSRLDLSVRYASFAGWIEREYETNEGTECGSKCVDGCVSAGILCRGSP